MSDEGEAQIRIVLPRMVLAEAHEISRAPRGQDPLHKWPQPLLRPSLEGREGEQQYHAGSDV
jgi:hypothetical protein